MRIGVIEFKFDPEGFVHGEFRVHRSRFTLDSAANFCGEDHFNWLQIVLFARHTGVDSQGNRLSWPFLDPPLGGFGDDPNTVRDDTLWADDRPYYFNEGPVPDPIPPRLDPLTFLDVHTGEDTLSYEDKPSHPAADQFIVFLTTLASVNADGSLHSVYGGYLWTWENTAQGGTTRLLKKIPEPTLLFLLPLGLAAASARVLTRRHRGHGSRQRADTVPTGNAKREAADH